MGIRNLYKLIKEAAAEAICDAPIDDLNGWRVCVDASVSIYQWCSVGETRHIVNARGNLINHIQGAFFRTLNMILVGIIPLYVFDGVPPKIKGAKLKRRTLRIPREVHAEVAKLLELMGVMTLQAPSEAEAQAAYLTTNGTADAVATEDMDVCAHGGKYLVRGLTTAKRVTIIETKKVLSGLGLNRDQFIDLCILLGCDYTETLPGIGYKRALGLIKKYGNIESIIAEKEIVTTFDYNSARAEFKNPLVLKNRLNIKIKRLTAKDLTRLRDFLLRTHGLELNRISKSLKKLADFHRIDWIG